METRTSASMSAVMLGFGWYGGMTGTKTPDSDGAVEAAGAGTDVVASCFPASRPVL